MHQLTQLAENLFVYHGAIQVGILRDGPRALLVDVGQGDVRDALGELGIGHVDVILLTHHHRDQASGAASFSAGGTRIVVPEAERAWFADVERFWNDPSQRWHLYDHRPHPLMLAQSIPVSETVRDGDVLEWGGAAISVIDTPGHTDGSVSYVVQMGEGCGAERHVFCGDVLYDEGKVWDLYSLQKGWETRDYHGFMGDRERLTTSLRKLGAVGAAALIPSHGNVMRDPVRATSLVIDRLAQCYERYAAVSALRHYFPGMFAVFRSEPRCPDDGLGWREGFMPIREGKPYPEFMRHVGTSWIVSSQDGPAFLIDCGARGVIGQIQQLQTEGALGPVEWLWITHYHDDHVDAIPECQQTFGCSVVADESVAQVVEDPLGWRLPCISPVRIAVDRRASDGETWRWHEFTITAYHLPGQTLYHGGLLVEGRGRRLFFAGDSFTMAGIDDYCAGNRNLLGHGVGFEACVELVQRLQPDTLFNCHVDVGFDLSAQECAFIRANLAEREGLFGELLDWDHPNYGLDEHWARCYPYEQHVPAGSEARISVVFTNHSDAEREAACRLVLPVGWRTPGPPQQGVAIPPKAEGDVAFRITVPSDARSGRWVVPVDVTYGGRRLGPFREAIVVVI